MKELRGSWRFLGGLFLALLFLCMLSLPTMAADKAELFGGYQYGWNPGGSGNGWEGAITGKLNRWFGITGDVSGLYGGGASGYTFMAGPTISAGAGGVKPFVHALFGGVHASGFGFSGNGFAAAVGGGVDFRIAPHLAVRAPQVDWMLFHGGGGTAAKNVRVSAGIVLRF